MIIIELTEDKFGKAMKDIACIEDKLEVIKELFETEAIGYRKHRTDEPDYYSSREMREPRRERMYGRYE